MIKNNLSIKDSIAWTFLPEKSDIGKELRLFNWMKTPLGHPANWPFSLRTLLATMLQSAFPSLMFWGEELTCFYNDAYRPLLGIDGKHPSTLGKPAKEAYTGLWDTIGPLLGKVLENGETIDRQNMPAPIYRNGKIENAYWTFSCSPVRDENGSVRGVLVVCTETTQNTVRFKNIVESATGPIMIFKGEDLIVEVANQATLDLWQADESVIGKPFLEVKPEFRDQAYPDLLRNVLRTGEPFKAHEYPAVFVREGGVQDVRYFNFEYVPYREANGDITGITIIANDVTEAVTNRQRLGIAEDEMQVAVAAASLGYWNYNPATGTFKCNDITRELFGLPSDENVDLALAINNIHPADRERVTDAIRAAMAFENNGRYSADYRVVNPVSNRQYFVRASGQAYRNEAGEVIRLSGTAQDITEDKSLEAALRASEEKYRGLFENMDQGFCIIEVLFDAKGNGADFRFVDSNEQFTLHSGLKDAVGKTMRELVPEIEDVWSRTYGEVVKTGQPAHFTQVSEALQRWFEVSAYRLGSEESHLVAILFSDVTERKKADAEIRKFYALAENSSEFIGMCDMQGRPFYGNPAALSLVGFNSLDEFTQAPVGEFFFPEDQGTILNEFFPRVMQEGKGEIEVRFRHFKTGQPIWMLYNVFTIYNDKGEPAILATVSRNIHAQKEAQLERDRQRRLLETVTGNTQDLIYVFDLDYRFTYANAALLRMWGRSWEEAIGRGLRRLGYEEWHAQMHEREIDEVVATRQPIRGTVTFPHAELGTRYYDYIFVPVVNSSGQMEAVAGTTRDITDIKLAEAQVRQAAENYQATFDNAAVGIAQLTPDARWLFINDRLATMLGYTKEELFQKSLPELSHPEDMEQDATLMEQILAGNIPVYSMEKRYFRKDGSVLWANLSVSVVRNAEGEPQHFVSIVEDISSRKQAELALRQSEQRLRHIIQSNIIGAFYWDLDSGITDVNDAFLNMLGYSRAEIVQSRNWLDLTPPGYEAQDQDGVDQLLAKGYHEPFEKQYLHKNGTPVDVIVGSTAFEGTGNRKGITFVINISDRKKTEAALKESEAQLLQLSDFMPQMVWATKADGYHDFYNQRWYDFTGLSYEETKNTGWSTVLHPEDYERTWKVWNHSLQTGDLYEIEYRMRRWDGEYRWWLARATPFRNTHGQIVRWLGTCTDIHDQKLQEQVLEDLVAKRTEELRRSNEDLQQFAHVASHDLKEPIRKIRTFSSRLIDEFGALLPEKGIAYLGKIEKGADRMYDMINGVLLYSSLEATNQTTEKVDVNEIIKSIQSDLEVVIAQKEATVQAGNLPVVEGVPILMYQLFYNLINNSLKFAKPAKRPVIKLSSKPVNADEAKALALDIQRRYVKIRVQDNGIGFAEAEAERIFQTFARLHSKDQYEGTGLGLALCKKITERHGGTIKAKAKEGEGATFNVILPINNQLHNTPNHDQA